MYLLDTHRVLWAALEPSRLSRRATRRLRSRETSVAFSLVTIWEVAIKTSLGRPGFEVDPSRLHAGLLAAGFAELPVRPQHLFRVAALPWVHRDPFDRLLVAQAIEERLVLLTADVVLRHYGRFVKPVRARAGARGRAERVGTSQKATGRRCVNNCPQTGDITTMARWYTCHENSAKCP